MTSEFTWQPQRLAGTLGAGTRVAGYLLEEQVGAGGMAMVFRARDETLERPVAIKLMAPALASDAVFRARFLRESRAVATVESPHIIPVYAAGDAGGVLYIATRFVGGGDLGRLVRRSGGALAPSLAATLITQIASALDAAHAAGLVHRDVKPANVLVESAPGQAPHTFLSDFGLSKSSLSATSGLSATGQFLGTPDYSPPEQIRGETVDGRADQYALACVAFALLAGAPPFRRADTIAILYAHLNDPVPSLSAWRPELPAAIDSVLQQALAKAPARQYRTCGEFATALRDALAGRRAATVSSVDFASGQGPGERGDARFTGRGDGPSSTLGPSWSVSQPPGPVSRAVSMPSGQATTETQLSAVQGISDTVSGRGRSWLGAVGFTATGPDHGPRWKQAARVETSQYRHNYRSGRRSGAIGGRHRRSQDPARGQRRRAAGATAFRFPGKSRHLHGAERRHCRRRSVQCGRQAACC